MPKYRIRENRIKRGYLEGFSLEEGAKLVFDGGSLYHALFLRGLDGADTGAMWGRLSFKASCRGDVIFSVYTLALDDRVIKDERGKETDADIFFSDRDMKAPEKLDMLKKMGAVRHTGTSDILLYDLKGRYLYVAIEAVGEGSLVLSELTVDSTGDNFMDTYPEIYRERGSFFHRFISVFSSIYNDYGRELDDLPKLLDLDTCPEELLIIYGGWMGIELRGGVFETGVLRSLVKEAYELNRMKGTRRAIERILEIILGEPAIVIEHNRPRKDGEDGDMIPESLKGKGIFDVTVLVKKHLTEELRHQILFILSQFGPVRVKMSIVQLDETPTVDSNTYLDTSFCLPKEKNAGLDEDFVLDGTIVLE